MTDIVETELIAQSIRACQLSLQEYFGLGDSAFNHFETQILTGGFGGGVGGTAVYEVFGSGWSVVVKVLEARPEEQPTDSHYWAREAAAYQAPWLQQLPTGLHAPRCFGVVRPRPGLRVIVLEQVQDQLWGKWPLAQHLQVARDMGRFNGAFGGAVPPESWLSRRWIQQDVERFGARIMTITDFLDHPWLREWLHPAKINLQHRLWNVRESLFAQLDSLPQTLCHLDAFRRNCFVTPQGTVAIDWSFVGEGPIGADFSALFWVNAIFQEIDLQDAAGTAEKLLQAYLNGLQDAGWQGDPLVARRGCVIALALRQLAGIGIQVYEIHAAMQQGQPPHETHIWHMQRAGQVIDEWCAQILFP